MALPNAATLEATITSIQTAIDTYLATGQLPMSYTLPTGLSVNRENILRHLNEAYDAAIMRYNQFYPQCVVSRGR